MPTAKIEAKATRESWAEAGLAALVLGGVEAVRVEPLAKRLGVTKGSFYWHFENREALLEAALALWEQRGTTDVIAELTPLADPAERLRRLFRRVSDFAKGAPAHTALAAAREPSAKRALKRVTDRRLEFLTGCYAELGMAPRAAKRRALLAYATYLGTMQVLRDSPAVLAAGAERDAYTDHVIETLVPKG